MLQIYRTTIEIFRDNQYWEISVNGGSKFYTGVCGTELQIHTKDLSEMEINFINGIIPMAFNEVPKG